MLLAATDNLWKTRDFFSGAGPRCTGTAPRWTPNSPEMRTSISAVAFAPSDVACNTYAFGTTDGRILVTANGGVSWKHVAMRAPTNTAPDPDNVPDRYVTDLAFDPRDASVLYASFSGFDEGTPDQPGHLFKSTNVLDASPVWANVSPPGANIPHNTIAVDG